jgi:hypothetical protein
MANEAGMNGGLKPPPANSTCARAGVRRPHPVTIALD